MCASLRAVVLVLSTVVFSGCGGAVRESRRVNWSADGKEVALAHGDDGVFVAGKDGKPLKIFQPDAGVIATSPPLWAPNDRRLIFTVARSSNPKNGITPPNPQADPPPDGAIVFGGQCTYTCYLRTGDQEPESLFTAACDSPGYVAANLAVRWSPDGKRVLYVAEAGSRQHTLFEYDLKTKKSRQALPFTAPGVVFDFSPNGLYLACALGGPTSRGEDDGIWIRSVAIDAWWHVPCSESLPVGEFDSTLEKLRAALPAWSADGTRFVFGTHDLGIDLGPEGCWWCPVVPQVAHRLHLVTLMDRAFTTIAVSHDRFRDLAWSPDGKRIGVVSGGERGALYVFRPEEKIGAPFVNRPVRRFAGWDSTGKQLAYVTVADVPGQPEPVWNWLLPPDALSRDTLFVMSDGGKPEETPALSGARFTFLQWSPTEPLLSLWITFTPTHRSIYSQMHDAGLRPGDPAAVFDPRTGVLSWKAVNAHEWTQVGHYCLATGDAAEAWRWYMKGEEETKPRTPDERMDAILNGRDASFFQYITAIRLGQHEEAAKRLQCFDDAFRPRPNAVLAGRAGVVILPHRLHHLRDRYAAEVFLSLGAIDEGEEFFRGELQSAGDDDARLSHALVLSQFLLMQKKHAEFADLMTEVVLPLLPRCRRPASDPVAEATERADYRATLPLSSPTFLAMLPQPMIKDLLPRWQELRSAAATDEQRLALDLMLAGANRHCGRLAEADSASQSVRENPEWKRNRGTWDAEVWTRIQAAPRVVGARADR
jgi:hypothetical protein